MRVIDILAEDLVIPHLQSTTKTDVLHELARHLAMQRADIRAEHLVTVLLDRERLGTTAIGGGSGLGVVFQITP